MIILLIKILEMKYHLDWFPDHDSNFENSDFNLNGILDKDELEDWTFPNLEYVYK